ncbi:hypothetical protein [Sphingomicrobium flavum]|uniref:hypothetical protein n=1 Tax=Sphingomicrobium flavum TaxID=1229164 RepID=UPI0021AD84DE|nr:hypothetical protein [Sphingomicrobium flavum]
MKTRLLVAAAGTAFLSGCDAAMDQFDGPVREAFVARCEGVAENMGISAEAVTPMCSCSADKILEKDASQLAEVDSARIQEILAECAEETGGTATATDQSEPGL